MEKEKQKEKEKYRGARTLRHRTWRWPRGGRNWRVPKRKGSSNKEG